MEVELLQCIPAVTDLQRVTSREAKLYSVAVVDYLLWLLSQLIWSGGCRAPTAPVMSMGDC